MEASDVVEAAYEHKRVLGILLDDLPPSQAAKLAAKICDASKGELYELAVELQNESQDP